MDDQEFLNQTVQNAADENEKKAVLLRYQQAAFETLCTFEPCKVCSALDLTLLRRRARNLLATTKHYQAAVAVLPMARVTALITESQTLFLDVGQLCPSCQTRIPEQILASFRRNAATH